MSQELLDMCKKHVQKILCIYDFRLYDNEKDTDIAVTAPPFGRFFEIQEERTSKRNYMLCMIVLLITAICILLII